MTDTPAVSAASAVIIHGIIRREKQMIKILKICIIALACPFLIPLVVKEGEEEQNG